MRKVALSSGSFIKYQMKVFLSTLVYCQDCDVVKVVPGGGGLPVQNFGSLDGPRNFINGDPPIRIVQLFVPVNKKRIKIAV